MWHAKLPRVLTPEVPALSIGSHHRDVKGARADLLQKISENNEIWWTIVTYSNYVQCCAIKSMCRINMITLDRMEAPGTLLPVNSLEVDANGLSAETAIEQEIVCCRGGQCTLRGLGKTMNWLHSEMLQHDMEKRSGYFHTFWNTRKLQAQSYSAAYFVVRPWHTNAVLTAAMPDFIEHHTLFHQKQTEISTGNKISKSSKLKEKMPKSTVRLCQLMSIDVNWCQLMSICEDYID